MIHFFERLLNYPVLEPKNDLCIPTNTIIPHVVVYTINTEIGSNRLPDHSSAVRAGNGNTPRSDSEPRHYIQKAKPFAFYSRPSIPLLCKNGKGNFVLDACRRLVVQGSAEYSLSGRIH
jgi:hypothetical protein